MSSNDKSSVNFHFDLDSILSEFGSLDEEPVSEKPVFEPREPIKDASGALDEVFSAAINDGINSAPVQKEYDFDPDAIAAEFESEDSVSESTSKLDPEKIRREFASEDSIRSPAPAKEAAALSGSAETGDTDEMLDEVDRFEIKGAELTLFDDHKALAVFKAVEKEPAKQ